MAIGYNSNDLPMFDFAGYRVAVGNCTEELRQAARIIAPGNEEEAAAWVLERRARNRTAGHQGVGSAPAASGFANVTRPAVSQLE